MRKLDEGPAAEAAGFSFARNECQEVPAPDGAGYTARNSGGDTP
jgi:hypothetical protein